MERTVELLEEHYELFHRDKTGVHISLITNPQEILGVGDWNSKWAWFTLTSQRVYFNACIGINICSAAKPRGAEGAMCRYAFKGPYKRHFACFECRKAFKRPPLTEWDDAAADPAPCPECGVRMADMGLDFAPPPMDDVEHWEVAANLFSQGFGHHNCGCGGTGPLPSRWSEVPAFLEARRRESPGQQLLARFAER